MYLPIAYGGTVYFAQPDALKVRNHAIFSVFSTRTNLGYPC